MVEPTNINDPNFYHKVIDCQWACPAHTNVPKYLRLISQGRYDEAYLENRSSNVFPGILGRTCDRPCEPACRRVRVDGNPVAICRLKRVASDLADGSVKIPSRLNVERNGKRIVCIGAGPASLAVANDLLPLGYEVEILESSLKSGGLMRTNIPAFRLPTEVLDQEIDSIITMGALISFDCRVESMSELLKRSFDAVFVGSGAPKGKDLKLKGRESGAANIHIGIEWLQAVAFDHISSVGKKVIVVGVGNTAMDCCRTALRLGGEEVFVVARRPREFFKASPWELSDAEEEGVNILVNYSPSEFVLDGGKLVGMRFDVLEWDVDARHSQVVDSVVIDCDDVILAIGQENAFEWIERGIGIDFNDDGMPIVDELTMQSTLDGVFFGGDAAWGPKNIIWAVAHGHEAAISIHNWCQGIPIDERPPLGMNLISQKMGISEWSYNNDYNPSDRQQMVHVELTQRFSKLSTEVELGFSPDQAAIEVQRCLNCDIQTVFRAELCIECDACVDICPVSCLTITEPVDDETFLRQNLMIPAKDMDQELYVSSPLPQTGRIMVQDENLCVHCGLCAERCPTAAWDMQKFELELKYAGAELSRGRYEADRRQ